MSSLVDEKLDKNAGVNKSKVYCKTVIYWIISPFWLSEIAQNSGNSWLEPSYPQWRGNYDSVMVYGFWAKCAVLKIFKLNFDLNIFKIAQLF